VLLGAGSKILGGLRIGDNATVGANAVVVDSVAANSTVVGIPARSIFKKSDIGEQASDNTIEPASAARAASS
jgi:serine O-acetyltransferase